MAPAESTGTRRLFFALWPDVPLREEILRRRALLKPSGWRAVPAHNLHLTLLFLGNQPSSALGDIDALGGQLCLERSRLRLDRFGWFPGARVLWLGGSAPEPIQAWVDALSSGMDSLGLSVERRPFKPHVTLFRRVLEAPDLPEPEPLDWSVRGLSLIESLPSRPYQVLRTWSVN